MEYVNGALSGIKTLYEGMNPATLSGAIDVVVVRQADGSLKCSPFHVRFGKLNVVFPAEKVVRIKINGEKSKVRMKLGPGGEAFFVSDISSDLGVVQPQQMSSPIAHRAKSMPPTPRSPPAVLSANSIETREEARQRSAGARIRLESECSDADSTAGSDVGAAVERAEAEGPIQAHVDRMSTWEWGALPEQESESEAGPATEDVVSLSLCGRTGVADFDKHLVSSEDFQANPGLLKDPSLVVRIGGTFYPWDVAAPIIMSKLVFSAPLGEATIGDLLLASKSSSEATAAAEAAEADDSARKGTGWWPFGSKEQQRAAQGGTSMQAVSPTVPRAAVVPEPPAETKEALAELKQCTKSLTLDTTALMELNLKDGANDAEFTVISKMQGRAVIKCAIHLWNHDDCIVISDVDGTITKSDIMGHAANILGTDWTHKGVADLYTSIEENGFKFLYLTSRSISHAPLTRDFLNNVKQDERFELPRGPCLFSPQNFLRSIHREVIARNPQVFKMACLTSIMNLFPERADGTGPFHAGFGNRHTDEVSYEAVKIPNDRIFTVDPDGTLKMGVSTMSRTSSYTELRGLRDLYFPPKIQPESASGRKYNDSNYWTPTKSYTTGINIDAELDMLLNGSSA